MTQKVDGRFTYNGGYASFDMLVQHSRSSGSVIAIVGSTMSSEDIQTLAPFNGVSGWTLKNWLYLQGISWMNCFMTNVIGDRVDTVVTLQDKQALFTELTQVKPKAILLVGEMALNTVAELTKISYWRGSVLEWKGIKVIPIYTLADVMRDYSLAPICIADIGKLKTPYIPVRHDNCSYTLDMAPHQLKALCDRSWAKILIDVETVGEAISMVGLALQSVEKGDWVYYNWDTKLWEVEEIRALGKLLSSPALKIGHNLAFDCMLLWHNWKIMPATPWFDTMLAWHAHDPELPKALGVCATLCCETRNWKADSTQNLAWYNYLDLWHTVKLYEHLENSLTDVLQGFNLMMSLIEPVIWMQLRGLRVDKRKLLEMQCEYESKLSEISLPFNPLSPKQVLDYVKSIGIKPKISRITHKPTVNEDSLLQILTRTGDFNIAQTLKAREITKVLSTLESATGQERLRTSYNISGTTSGRFSSSAGLFGGTNVQNWAEKLRVIFTADEDMIFLEADLSQAEARVVAWESQDELFMSFFASGDAFEKIKEALKLKDHPTDTTLTGRQRAKKLAHAVHYGMRPKTCAASLKVSFGEATNLITNYFQLFPGVARFQAQVAAQVRQHKVLYSPLGRKRIFHGRMGEQLINEALSFIPQSVVVDIANMGMVKLFKLGYDILAQNHDAVLLQVPQKELARHIPIVLAAMTIPINIRGKNLTIPVSCKVGKNWGIVRKES